MVNVQYVQTSTSIWVNLISIVAIVGLVLASVALYKAYNSNILTYSGIANNLTWTQIGSTGFYTASIPVRGISANTLIQSTLSVPPSNTADVSNCWIVSSYSIPNNVVFIAAANPTTPSQFPIAWTVFKY